MDNLPTTTNNPSPTHPTAQTLLSTCHTFLTEIENLTPGAPLESHLNATYPPTSALHTTLTTLSLRGLHEGWLASTPVDGARYRRSRFAAPSEATRWMSITAVYISSSPSSSSSTAAAEDSEGEREGEEGYKGQYHAHPYGEINCVIPVDEGAELKGMSGWQGAGWTSPGPGTHHYPQVRGGAVIALFFLPAGRISYSAKPSDPQPDCV